RTILFCIDFKEPSALIAPGEAILNPEYCEGFVTGAHEYVTVPGARADVIDNMEIVKTALQLALYDNRTIACRRSPPAYAQPATLGAVAQRDGNEICRLIAYAQVGPGGRGKCQEARDGRDNKGRSRTDAVQGSARNHREKVQSCLSRCRV